MAKRPRKPSGFRETQTPFGTGVDFGSLFQAYGSSCAFTGRDLSREAAIDPRGYLLNIGSDPFTTEPTLLIPASLDAIHAYERGHIALGRRYNMLVDLELIAPEFLVTLNPIGRLRLPAIEALYPSPDALAVQVDRLVNRLLPATRF